jgi:hypothetical protein
MSLPNGRILLCSKSLRVSNPWIKANCDPQVCSLACTEPSALTASVFIADAQRSFLTLQHQAKPSLWVSRISGQAPSSNEYSNSVLVAKEQPDQFCNFQYEALSNGTFALKCDDGRYWQVDPNRKIIVMANGSDPQQDDLCQFAFQPAS